MRKFIKELFSLENLKIASLGILFSNPSLTTSDYARISNAIKVVESKTNEKEKLESEIKEKEVSYAL